MEQRLLGSLATSAQGLGCMGLATVYGRVDPAEARATLDAAIEAGVTTPWWKYVGSDGRTIGIDHFGASADGALLFKEFGITTDAVIQAAKESVASAQG